MRTQINIRISEELLQVARIRAAEEGRDLSNYIRRLIIRDSGIETADRISAAHKASIREKGDLS